MTLLLPKDHSQEFWELSILTMNPDQLYHRKETVKYLFITDKYYYEKEHRRWFQMLAKLPKKFNYDDVVPMAALKTVTFQNVPCDLMLHETCQWNFSHYKLSQRKILLHIHRICFLNYIECKRILSPNILSRTNTFNRLHIPN